MPAEDLTVSPQNSGPKLRVTVRTPSTPSRSSEATTAVEASTHMQSGIDDSIEYAVKLKRELGP